MPARLGFDQHATRPRARPTRPLCHAVATPVTWPCLRPVRTMLDRGASDHGDFDRGAFDRGAFDRGPRTQGGDSCRPPGPVAHAARTAAALGHGQDVGAQHAPLTYLELEASAAHDRRSPEAGVGEGVPAVVPFLEQDDPVEAGTGAVMAQCGQSGAGFLAAMPGRPGSRAVPRATGPDAATARPRLRSSGVQAVQVRPSDRQVHDGAGRHEGGDRAEVEPRGPSWPAAALLITARARPRSPARTLSGGTSVRWGATEPSALSPSARRRPSTSREPAGRATKPPRAGA